MVTASIEQAIFDATMIALANPPSAVVRPYFDRSLEGKKLLQKTIGIVDKYEQRVDEFKLRGACIREALTERFAAGKVTLQHLDNLGKLITAIEDKACSKSQEFRKEHKDLKTVFHKFVKYLPDLKVQFAEQVKRMEFLKKSNIDELTEMALFLRALKSKYSPTKNLSQPFTNKIDMENYLTRLIA